MDYRSKKLLILGGAFQQCKLVNEAKAHGIYTIRGEIRRASPARRPTGCGMRRLARRMRRCMRSCCVPDISRRRCAATP